LLKKHLILLRSLKQPFTENSVKFPDCREFSLLKVAEHSFQEPMPNSPFRLGYLCFGARFLQESRLTTEEFIRAF